MEVFYGKRNELYISQATEFKFINFSGTRGNFPAPDKHEFSVGLDAIGEDQIKKLIDDGLNISDNADYDPRYLLKVHINYKFGEPEIYKYKDGRKYRITEDNIKYLDNEAIESMDIVVNVSRTNGNVYAKEINIFVEPPYFGHQERYQGYSDIDDSDIPEEIDSMEEEMPF